MSMRKLILILTLLLPQRAKRLVLCRLLGYSVHPTAKIGLSIVDADRVVLHKDATIGHFTVVRNLKSIELEEGAGVGAWNWFAAAPDIVASADDPFAGCCYLRYRAQITSRHYIDCAGGFDIGRYSLMAGVRSTVISHQINVVESVQSVGKVTIGDYCLLGSNTKILPGSTISDRSVVAMGSIVRGVLEPPGYLWAGVPASQKRQVGGQWFSRKMERARWPNEPI